MGFPSNKENESVSLSVMSDSVNLWTVAYQPPPSMKFSRQEYGMGCHSFLQGIFLTQQLNPGLMHGRQILYHLCDQEVHQW